MTCRAASIKLFTVVKHTFKGLHNKGRLLGPYSQHFIVSLTYA